MGRYVLDPARVKSQFIMVRNDGDDLDEKFAELSGEGNFVELDGRNYYVSNRAIGCYIVDINGNKYFIKGKEQAALSQELLYQKFAERNGIKCADVDVGVSKNGENCVISADVSSRGMYDENLTFGDFVALNSPFDLSSMDRTLDNYKILLNFVAQSRGARIDGDVNTLFIKKELLDYLTRFLDWHEDNFMVCLSHDNGLPKIRILPFFDNEYCFMIDEVDEFLKSANIDVHCENLQLIKEFYRQKTGEEVELPLVFIHNIEQDDDGTKNINEILQERKEIFLSQLANELIKDEKLMEYYRGLDFDLNALADEIKEETGYTIPQSHLTIANIVLQDNKKQLDKVIESKLNKEGEEHDRT